MKKLPIGIQTFSEIIEDNHVYIDKTSFALNLIEKGKYYFLSRPRRFGKSLFLDTLRNIFEGKKELFKGLYIEDKYNFTTYPVIKISFGGDLRSERGITQTILSILRDNQEKLQLECIEKGNYAVCFKEIIKKAYQKYNQKVVVLIDEYDKPILDNLDQMEMAVSAKEMIKSFYAVLKESDEYLRFVFLTGVSKFAKVSIFSGLNNIENITLEKEYATVCGYTQEDLETTFKEHLESVDKRKMKKWYNGYNFNGVSVYNPFDVLLFIRNNFEYQNYWFSTGTPTFLIKLLEKKHYFIPKLQNLKANQKLIDSFDIDNISLETILFQSGYLTLDFIKERGRGGLEYHLRIPNKEVMLSFNDMLIDFLTDQITEKMDFQDDLYDAVIDEDIEKIKNVITSLFASIPYTNYVNSKIGEYEGYYASVIYAYLASLGLKIIAEDITNLGRIDLTIQAKNTIYIIEFKVGDENALKQIKTKNYHQKYLNENKNVYLIGINFDKKEKNIKAFEYERVNLN